MKYKLEIWMMKRHRGPGIDLIIKPSEIAYWKTKTKAKKDASNNQNIESGDKRQRVTWPKIAVIDEDKTWMMIQSWVALFVMKHKREFSFLSLYLPACPATPEGKRTYFSRLECHKWVFKVSKFGNSTGTNLSTLFWVGFWPLSFS